MPEFRWPITPLTLASTSFWATIEHSLNYKYRGEYPEELHDRLIRAAEAAFRLDEEMSEIREEIKDAQRYFSDKKEDGR